MAVFVIILNDRAALSTRALLFLRLPAEEVTKIICCLHGTRLIDSSDTCFVDFFNIFITGV